MFCDTCGHQFSDVCGTCESLEGVPIRYSEKEAKVMRNIQCKKCFFFTPEWCPKKRDSLDPDLVRDCQYFRTKTNADRIRNMTDEELAKTILADWCSILCPGGSFFCDCECATKITEWLKQEVSDDS